jgi:NAD(P) transhydrogenase
MAITKAFDFICIGSGPAGQRAAVQAAKLGQRVCVIEKHPVLGGSCLNSGTIPSKTFRKAVLSLKLSNRGRVQSSYPSMSPPTMGELLDKVSLQVALESQIIEKQLARNGITQIRG